MRRTVSGANLGIDRNLKPCIQYRRSEATNDASACGSVELEVRGNPVRLRPSAGADGVLLSVGRLSLTVLLRGSGFLSLAPQVMIVVFAVCEIASRAIAAC
jgi:hypothetical protein